MKKLYIPTTTLNFNNIMSSESISPRTFYRERGYGYRTWYTLSGRDPDNAIVLFDKPFSFSRPASDVEDHPLLIEVQINEELPEKQKGVFVCDHTIYLSPWRTKFILFNEADKSTMLSMQVGSLETKMVSLYAKRIIVIEQQENGIIPEGIEDIPLNKDLLEKDVLFNKLKGLLYGYYIGALLSVSKELTYEYKRLYELYDIFSSVASSAEKRPTEYQKERLDSIFREENKNIPVVKELAAIKGMSESMLNEVIQVLLRNNTQPPQYLVASNFLTDISHTGKDGRAFSWIKEKLGTLDKDIRQSAKKISVHDEEIIISDGKLSKIKAAEDESLVRAWIDDVISKSEFNGDIQLSNKKLSDELTRKAKDICGSEWEGSEAREKLNRMRRFIAGQERIDNWDNGDISSMSSVLLKGDEWDKLLDFMRRKGMNDCRLAFAFYGMLHGFASLTRDFTDILLSGEDKRYIADVIKEINGQLLGDDLVSDTTDEDVLQDIEPPAIPSDTPAQTRSNRQDDVTEGEPSVTFCTRFMEKLKELFRPNSNVYKEFYKRGFGDETMAEESEFRKIVKDIAKPVIKGPKRDKIKKEAQLDEAISYALGKPYDSIPRDLFTPSAKSGPLLEGTSWIYETAKIITDSKVKKTYMEDAQWFQNEYKKGDQSRYYAKASRDNRSVIASFKRHLQKKQEEYKYETDEIEQIVDYLRERYDR